MSARLIPVWLSLAMMQGAIVDRTAIIVGTHVILDSEIVSDIRVTAFLNREQPDLSASGRKKAASRLIDQEIIREQARNGRYPVGQKAEAEQLLNELKNDRGLTGPAYPQALAQAGVTEAELKDRLLWQLTVLRFIDARFRPSVMVSDADVDEYYKAHQVQLKRPRAEVRRQIEDAISGERINQLLDDWLTENRKQTRIEFLEKSLQ